MNLADCYRLLEVTSDASIAEVKSSYRRLARKYHPDVNKSDRQAQDKFIAVTEAYQFLLDTMGTQGITTPPVAPTVEVVTTTTTATTKVYRKTAVSPPLSEADSVLKQQSYEHLQQLLKYQRFPRAIALIEGLAQRLPQDLEVRQWQAIAYQRFGRYLVNENQLDKARSYLKKALRTDPHNRSLWAEVERDFRRIEYML